MRRWAEANGYGHSWCCAARDSAARRMRMHCESARRSKLCIAIPSSTTIFRRWMTTTCGAVGQASCHVAFDEATAILAGDALLALAFEVLADEATHKDASVRSELIMGLAAASGGRGMVGGQMIDLVAEHTVPDIATITRMQRMKTGALIRFSCEAGAILAGATAEARHALHLFAHDLGFAFQITDDLLDAEGNSAALGKATQKDAAAGKATFVTVLGIGPARARARLLVRQATAHHDIFDEKAAHLRQIAEYVLERQR